MTDSVNSNNYVQFYSTMDRKILLNQLELAYSPLTAYEFAVVKNDKLIERALKRSSLYVIAQRPAITFENLYSDNKEFKLNFEIHQQGNVNILKCELPFDQEIFGLIKDNEVEIAINYLNDSLKEENPFSNIHGFSLLSNRNNKKEFIVWFSPEKLLQNWWKGFVNCAILGDWSSFLSYQVHYVGKATKQSILKRLTGHSTLQDILSLQTPVTEKQLPANEIVILPFEFQDNLQIESFSSMSNIDDMVDSFLGKNYPEQEKVFLDAEKALIKAMEPSYNNEMFKKYPISKDGLYSDKYNSISYTFTDPIILKYNNGDIRGGLTHIGGDTILISDNTTFELIKH